MKKTFTQKIMNTFGLLSRVTSSNDQRVDVSTQLDLKNVKVLTLPGITTRPTTGDSGVVIALDDGSFALLGNIKSTENKASGFMKLEVASGAYILLKENGDVEINSMVIAPNGTIR